MKNFVKTRKNVVTLTVIGLLVAISAIIAITVPLTRRNRPQETVLPTPPVTMKLPLAGNPTVSSAYLEDSTRAYLAAGSYVMYTNHPGIDFEAAEGTSVLSALPGVVKEVVNAEGNDIYVTIEHENGLTTEYHALKDVSVTKGQTVDQGAVIGTVGNSQPVEASQNHHLHFEVKLSGNHVNPANYISDLGSK